MVEHREVQLDSVFHALGDVTRRRMLRHLAQGERSVGQLAEPFQMSLAAASKHIKALEGAGLIRREIRGRTHICRLDAGPLEQANEWLRQYERFWSARLDRLEALLRQDVAKAEGIAGPPPAPVRAPAPDVSPRSRRKSQQPRNETKGRTR